MIKVKIPATSANLGPGFDVLGMALDLYNWVELDLREQGLEIEVAGEGVGDIPLDETNIVYLAAQQVFNVLGYQPSGLWMKLTNQIPVARGLGSSAAAIVGGIVAANELTRAQTGKELSTDKLLAIATQFEGHPDNVAPALLGGIIVSAVVDNHVVWQQIKVKEELKLVIAIPKFTLSTKLSREVLPDKVELKDAVFNMSRLGMVIMAFIQGDLKLLSQVMDDKLHQPYRSSLVPGMEQVFQALKKLGHPVALSGAGPTLISFCNTGAREIEQVMEDTFANFGVSCQVQTISPNNNGAEILSL